MKRALINLILSTLLCLFYISQFAQPWPAGYLGGFNYDYRIPLPSISTEYQGYYPYWGYGLGLGKELIALARCGKWETIRAFLQDQVKLYRSLPAVCSTEEKQRRTIRLKRLMLHLDGLPTAA